MPIGMRTQQHQQLQQRLWRPKPLLLPSLLPLPMWQAFPSAASTAAFQQALTASHQQGQIPLLLYLRFLQLPSPMPPLLMLLLLLTLLSLRLSASAPASQRSPDRWQLTLALMLLP